ncbi:hypothetical protein ABIA39_003408 [Nocardia sp. GAS34]|jgi:hypothetical protein
MPDVGAQRGWFGEMEGAAAPFAEDLARVGAVVDQDDEI